MWNNGKASLYSRNMSQIPHPKETSAGKVASNLEKKWKCPEKHLNDLFLK